jgi:hypothetical protein
MLGVGMHLCLQRMTSLACRIWSPEQSLQRRFDLPQALPLKLACRKLPELLLLLLLS